MAVSSKMVSVGLLAAVALATTTSSAQNAVSTSDAAADPTATPQPPEADAAHEAQAPAEAQAPTETVASEAEPATGADGDSVSGAAEDDSESAETDATADHEATDEATTDPADKTVTDDSSALTDGDVSSGDFDFGEQYPPPVEVNDTPLVKRRLLEVGAMVGPTFRHGGQEGISYGAGIGFGGYFRPQFTEWLSMRLSYRQEYSSVDVEDGAYDYGEDQYDFDFSQPNLDIVSFSLIIEPVWVVHARLRLFAQLGLGWGQLRAKAPQAEGFEFDAVRKGIHVDLITGLGATFDVVPDWFALGLVVGHSFAFEHRGTAYEPLQVIIDGSIAHMAPLPKTDGATEAILTLGLVL